MRHLHNLSLIALTKKIPIIITNMIRNMGDKEVENMRRAVDPYTHIKIQLSKNSSKYHGEVNWLLNHDTFTYRIGSSGLYDNEDF
jgi:DNA repair protein RAD51